jgi:hypothetical protein
MSEPGCGAFWLSVLPIGHTLRPRVPSVPHMGRPDSDALDPKSGRQPDLASQAGGRLAGAIALSDAIAPCAILGLQAIIESLGACHPGALGQRARVQRTRQTSEGLSANALDRFHFLGQVGSAIAASRSTGSPR